MFIFYVSFILVTVFFIVFGYYNQLDLQKERQYDKLRGIVSSTAISIDGDEHQKMMKENITKDAITSNEQHPTYQKIHNQLVEVAASNGIKTDVYTMVYNNDEDQFEFGVVSGVNPYFRHPYKDYPRVLIDSLDKGSIIPQYEDEHGVWLSAFHPITNSNGETVGVFQADIEFSVFIEMVQKEYLKESAIALAIILGLAFILILYARKVLKEEEKQQRKMREQSEIIAEKNRDITDSINYAQKIQNSILPALTDFAQVFTDFGILYKPKDIVAGDFYFMEREGDYVYIAAADCTGHGVPGAMVSVICSNALSFAINEKGLKSTREILDVVREIVVDKFQGSPDGIKDGMDVSLCRINVITNELEYSGANNPIYILKDGELNVLKPDKQPIGQFEKAKPFESHKRALDKGDLIYMFSDGYADQFGGARGKKLKYKPFKELILSLKDMSLDQQMLTLDQKFENWKGDFEQVDDVCVIGVRI